MYGIGPNSPLVVSFCLGNWNDTSGIKLDTFALAHLLGCTNHVYGGGWIGMARAFSGNTYGVDDIISYVWADYVQPQSLQNAKNTSAKKSCNPASATMSGVSGAMGAAGIAAMAAGPLGWSVLAAAGIAGLIGGATQGLLSATSQGCFSGGGNTDNMTLEDDDKQCSSGQAWTGICCPSTNSKDPSTNKDCSDDSCKTNTQIKLIGVF